MPRTPLVEPADALTPAESARFARQIALPHIGVVGQRRLKNARVLVAGAGGLGSPVISYLAAAGVGTLVIVDDDTVEESNLPRQLIHAGAAPGTPKAESAAAEARRLNPFGDAVAVTERIGGSLGGIHLEGIHLVMDTTDDAAARLVLHDAAMAAGIPYVWGTAVGTDGMVSVFWADAPGGGVTLRDLHPDPLADTNRRCVVDGVTGPLCAAIGGVMAGETLKLIVGAGDVLLGRVLVFDALDTTWREVALRPA
ncbi:HesA/MoeB/ThiF family protein [Microbacterium sp. bgisy203]|uniref:HesA/MoeB/ThiF family protein n=1 Tax=Microbacterium sp. bgisy203 TaxID=3413799 RepID=UPI003D73298C